MLEQLFSLIETNHKLEAAILALVRQNHSLSQQLKEKDAAIENALTCRKEAYKKLSAFYDESLELSGFLATVIGKIKDTLYKLSPGPAKPGCDCATCQMKALIQEVDEKIEVD